jgi:hypothetical protein
MLDLSTPGKKRAPRRLLDDNQRAVSEEDHVRASGEGLGNEQAHLRVTERVYLREATEVGGR